MKRFGFLLILAFTFVCSSCHFWSFNRANIEFPATTRNTNVCGHLKDTTILYAIFVDVGLYHPFSEYDIKSTTDSIEKAALWIENQATLHQQNISIKPVIHKTRSKLAFHEMKTLVRPNLHPFRMNHKRRNYVRYMNTWTDYISRYAGRGVKPRRSNKVTRRRIYDTESMIAALRNKYKTDNIALMFFVNGYYEHDISLTFNSYINGPAVEYSIITQKNPAVIAHEFLHLFGGVDLYPHDKHNFNFRDLERKYPNEIMRVTHKSIAKLSISPITQYYIGWKDTLSNHDLRLLYHLSDVVEY